MQGYTNPAMEKTMYLPLAERMVEKFMEEKKIDAEAGDGRASCGQCKHEQAVLWRMYFSSLF